MTMRERGGNIKRHSLVEDRRGRADVYRDRERTTTTTAVYAIAHV
jgi:hypothetical protein